MNMPIVKEMTENNIGIIKYPWLSDKSRLTMPPHSVSRDIKAQISILRYNVGYSVKEIGEVLGIKKSLIYNTLHLHRTHGLTYNPHSAQQSHRWHLMSMDI